MHDYIPRAGAEPARGMWRLSRVETFTRRELIAAGVGDAELRRRVSTGELRRLGRGVFVAGRAWPEREHRALALTVARDLRRRAVLSHESAAAVHGLGMLMPRLQRVHLTVGDGRRGRIEPARHLHRGVLDDEDIVLVDGVPVTSPARTAVDVAATNDRARALAIVDSTLRGGTTRDALTSARLRAGRRVGGHTARWAIDAGSAGAETVGESWSRAHILSWREFPPPRLQVLYEDGEGHMQVDFDWRGRLVGEFDGLLKYGAELDPERTAVIRERRREIRLQSLGVVVVRWGWDLCRRPELLRRRLRTAFERAGIPLGS